jgi:dienelactone hydrolase
LDVTDVETFEQNGLTLREITYASPGGGDVLATVAEAEAPATGAGVLMTHDIISLDSTTVESRETYADAIARFACAGATAMVVDAPWSREVGASHEDAFSFTDPQRDVAEQVQMVTDLRRAVDVLEDAGAERIGFDATGSGASLGVVLAGVEPRIDAFALLGGGPGPVARYISASGNGIGPAADTTPAERAEWADAMAAVAPAEFIGAATAPMLFLAGRDDQVFPPDEMQALLAGADDNAELRLYDAPRELNADAFAEHVDWLADQLGLDQARVDECFAGVDQF